MRRVVGWRSIGFFLAATQLMSGAVGAEEAERTAPYDFGCIGAPPCSQQWEPARDDGDLHAVVRPDPCFYYWVPFVGPCMSTVSSTAGIYVDLVDPAGLEVSARVRGEAGVAVSSPVSSQTVTRACLHLRSADGSSWSARCSRVVRHASVTVDLEQEIALRSGRHLLYVEMEGPGAVSVEGISWARS